MAGDLEHELQGPFQPRPFYNSKTLQPYSSLENLGSAPVQIATRWEKGADERLTNMFSHSKCWFCLFLSDIFHIIRIASASTHVTAQALQLPPIHPLIQDRPLLLESGNILCRGCNWFVSVWYYQALNQLKSATYWLSKCQQISAVVHCKIYIHILKLEMTTLKAWKKSLKETDLKIFQLQNNLVSHVGTLALIKNFVVTVILRVPFRNMTFRMPPY